MRVRAGALAVTAGGKATVMMCKVEHNVLGITVAPAARVSVQKSMFAHNEHGSLCFYDRHKTAAGTSEDATSELNGAAGARTDAHAPPHTVEPQHRQPRTPEDETAWHRRGGGGRGRARGARGGTSTGARAQAREAGAGELELMSNTVHGVVWATEHPLTGSTSVGSHKHSHKHKTLLHLRARHNVYIDAQGFRSND